MSCVTPLGQTNSYFFITHPWVTRCPEEMVASSITCRSRLDEPKGRRTMKARNSLRALEQKAGSAVIRRGRGYSFLTSKPALCHRRMGRLRGSIYRLTVAPFTQTGRLPEGVTLSRRGS